MAESEAADAEIFWCLPPERAVFIPESFHVPRRLARLVRHTTLMIRWNDDFAEVMRQCGSQRDGGSWINPVLLEAYTALHKAGDAFCLSVFDGDTRVGGVYGVQRGAVFMAESMFSRIPNASSIALVALMRGLARAGIELVDVQFENPHLEKFQPVLLSDNDYRERLMIFRQKPVHLHAAYFTL